MSEETIERLKNDLKRIREDQEEFKKKIEELQEQVKKLKKVEEEEEEQDSDEVLTNYIKSEWSTCNRLRGKVEWEGSDYFYNSYTTVPVSWETFSSFVRSDDCYCGECEK